MPQTFIYWVRKPLMFYYLIVLVVVILLNTLLFPRLMRQQITQVDYGTFIDMLERRDWVTWYTLPKKAEENRPCLKQGG